MSSVFGTWGQQSNQNNNAGGGLFGSNQPSSLFKNTNPNQGTQSQPGNTSLFSNLQQQQQQSQQQPPTNATPNNAFMSSTTHFPAQLAPNVTTDQPPQDLARSRLQMIGVPNPLSNEKSILDQAKTVIIKWDPNAQDSVLQAYLYNVVNAAYAPFYHRNPDESEREWERALAQAPKGSAEGEKYVPVLVRGFFDLGKRIEVQAASVREMRSRLHEMNNSLTEVMRRCRHVIASRVDEAARMHAVLQQRCLKLAVKVQVLRNRGYALDGAEEALRKQLQTLERSVMDPNFGGREEEIWARMVALRERARWLEEESARVGRQVNEQGAGGQAGGNDAVPEEVLVRTKRILQDYDGQLAHLAREVVEVEKEFVEFEKGQGGVGR